MQNIAYVGLAIGFLNPLTREVLPLPTFNLSYPSGPGQCQRNSTFAFEVSRKDALQGLRPTRVMCRGLGV